MVERKFKKKGSKKLKQKYQRRYYRDYGISTVSKEFKERQLVHKLYSHPKKDKGKNMPSFY